MANGLAGPNFPGLPWQRPERNRVKDIVDTFAQVEEAANRRRLQELQDARDAERLAAEKAATMRKVRLEDEALAKAAKQERYTRQQEARKQIEQEGDIEGARAGLRFLGIPFEERPPAEPPPTPPTVPRVTAIDAWSEAPELEGPLLPEAQARIQTAGEKYLGGPTEKWQAARDVQERMERQRMADDQRLEEEHATLPARTAQYKSDFESWRRAHPPIYAIGKGEERIIAGPGIEGERRQRQIEEFERTVRAPEAKGRELVMGGRIQRVAGLLTEKQADQWIEQYKKEHPELSPLQAEMAARQEMAGAMTNVAEQRREQARLDEIVEQHRQGLATGRFRSAKEAQAALLDRLEKIKEYGWEPEKIEAGLAAKEIGAEAAMAAAKVRRAAGPSPTALLNLEQRKRERFDRLAQQWKAGNKQYQNITDFNAAGVSFNDIVSDNPQRQHTALYVLAKLSAGGGVLTQRDVDDTAGNVYGLPARLETALQKLYDGTLSDEAREWMADSLMKKRGAIQAHVNSLENSYISKFGGMAKTTPAIVEDAADDFEATFQVIDPTATREKFLKAIGRGAGPVQGGLGSPRGKLPAAAAAASKPTAAARPSGHPVAGARSEQDDEVQALTEAF